MLSPSNQFTGYIYGNEADQVAFAAASEPTLLTSITLPEEVDPTIWHLIEDQLRQGSCQGNMLTTILEGCMYYDTGNNEPNFQLSRNAAYRFSQEEDGIRGDQGSTLEGGIAAARKGLPLAKYFPYTETYSSRIPEAARKNRDYKLVTANKLPKNNQPHEVAHNALGSRLYLIGLGMKWTNEMDSQSVIMRYTGRGAGGGHAVAIVGYKFIDGELYFWLANSWGTRFWGQKGYKLVHYKAFDQIMAHGWNVGFTYSDLKDFDKPRYDFSIITDIL